MNTEIRSQHIEFLGNMPKVKKVFSESVIPNKYLSILLKLQSSTIADQLSVPNPYLAHRYIHHSRYFIPIMN